MPIQHLITRVVFLLINIPFVFNVSAQCKKITLTVGSALNVNDMDWSIAGNSQGQSPNILSELNFRDIKSAGFYLGGSYVPFKYLGLEANYQRNTVFRGTGIDTDYAGDNRTNPTYRQPFSSEKGHLETFKVGINSTFLQVNTFTLGAALLYKNTTQNFLILDPDLTSLQSNYLARWRGPNVSIESTYNIFGPFTVGFSLSYAFIQYRAKADWNLIDIFQHPLSFEHVSRGQERTLDVNFSYLVYDFLEFSLNGQLGKSNIKPGTDLAYLKNGTQLLTQFNGSVNKYFGFLLGANFKF